MKKREDNHISTKNMRITLYPWKPSTMPPKRALQSQSSNPEIRIQEISDELPIGSKEQTPVSESTRTAMTTESSGRHTAETLAASSELNADDAFRNSALFQMMHETIQA